MAASSQATALGAAILGAVAAGRERGWYGNFQEAAAKLARVKKQKHIQTLTIKEFMTKFVPIILHCTITLEEGEMM